MSKHTGAEVLEALTYIQAYLQKVGRGKKNPTPEQITRLFGECEQITKQEIKPSCKVNVFAKAGKEPSLFYFSNGSKLYSSHPDREFVLVVNNNNKSPKTSAMERIYYLKSKKVITENSDTCLHFIPMDANYIIAASELIKTIGQEAWEMVNRKVKWGILNRTILANHISWGEEVVDSNLSEEELQEDFMFIFLKLKEALSDESALDYTLTQKATVKTNSLEEISARLIKDKKNIPQRTQDWMKYAEGRLEKYGVCHVEFDESVSDYKARQFIKLTEYVLKRLPQVREPLTLRYRKLKGKMLGGCISDYNTVIISSKIKPADLEGTLAHELAHLFDGDGDYSEKDGRFERVYSRYSELVEKYNYNRSRSAYYTRYFNSKREVFARMVESFYVNSTNGIDLDGLPLCGYGLYDLDLPYDEQDEYLELCENYMKDISFEIKPFTRKK